MQQMPYRLILSATLVLTLEKVTLVFETVDQRFKIATDKKDLNATSTTDGKNANLVGKSGCE